MCKCSIQSRCLRGKLGCKVQVINDCESQSGQCEGRTRESWDVSEGVPEITGYK